MQRKIMANKTKAQIIEDAENAALQVAEEKAYDWVAAKRKGFVCNYDPITNTFDGPEDAPVFYGQPYEGNPYEDHLVSTELGGVKVKWLEWDEETHCNVYLRVVEKKKGRKQEAVLDNAPGITPGVTLVDLANAEAEADNE
jgi:hypothetical protein